MRDARDARRYLRQLRFSCAPRRLHALATLEPARCAPLWCVSSYGSWGAARAMLATLALRAARALRAAPCACAVLAALAVLATLARVRSLASLANLSCVCGCEWCDRVSETGTGVISKPLFSSLSFPFLPPWRFCALRARLRRVVFFSFSCTDAKPPPSFWVPESIKVALRSFKCACARLTRDCAFVKRCDRNQGEEACRLLPRWR